MYSNIIVVSLSNRIGGVIVSVFALSAVEIVSSSPSRVKLAAIM
jgi:hypothetical protein